jgi:hypothetical protein
MVLIKKERENPHVREIALPFKSQYLLELEDMTRGSTVASLFVREHVGLSKTIKS